MALNDTEDDRTDSTNLNIEYLKNLIIINIIIV